jgi:hypothetical protein
MSTPLGQFPEKRPSITDFPICKLSPEEINNPYLVLNDFFSIGHLPEVREKLWEFFKVTITGSYPERLDTIEKIHLVCLYEYLEKLVEAVYLINECRQTMGMNNEPNISMN